MGNDRNRDSAAVYKEIIAILKARVIRAQDETIRMLQGHADGAEEPAQKDAVRSGGSLQGAEDILCNPYKRRRV